MKPASNFRIPQTAVDQADENSARRPDQPQILVVEDEQLIALDLKRRLGSLGYYVAGIAASGEEALALAHLIHPDLVLVDVHLAGEMDGVELAQRLNAELSSAVIYVTGNSDASTLVRTAATHPYNTILKPVRDRELRISIESALHHNQLRRELQDARDLLEKRVQERTRELEEANRRLVEHVAEHVRLEARLREARVIAEAAARSRTRFFSNVTHEIRTPMNGILGMAELMEVSALSDEQKECLAIVKSCASNLLGMIDGVIALADLESGHVEIGSRAVYLREQVLRILIPTELRAKEARLELTCDIAPEVPRVVYTDPGRLEQVLRHLLEFCLQFTTSGSLEVLVEQLSESANRAHIHFSVRARELSLDPDVRDRVQRLFDNPEASVRDLESVDFGLAVPALLVPKLQGILWLETVPGNGTTFHCSLWLPTSSG